MLYLAISAFTHTHNASYLQDNKFQLTVMSRYISLALCKYIHTHVHMHSGHGQWHLQYNSVCVYMCVDAYTHIYVVNYVCNNYNYDHYW